MKTFTILFVFLSILKPSFSQNNFTDNYPLSIGNIFVYSWSSWGGGLPQTGVKKIYISSDTVVSGVRYFKFRDGNNSSFRRLDSMSGKMLVLSSACLGVNEYMLDSLWAGLNETALRCTGRIISCTSVAPKLLFGINCPAKIFQESLQAPSGFFTITREYAKGFGLIHYSSVYVGHPSSTGLEETLRGCVINGIVYGDTSMIINGFTNLGNNVPNSFSISQNYPNPFNPLTTIKINIPEGSNVSFIIYDILGNELHKENEYLTAGTYEFKWDARNYSSGIYFYRIEVTDDKTNKLFAETKKMVLLK